MESPRGYMTLAFEVYFRRPDDCVVYAPIGAPQEISLLHRQADGSWHCALCGETRCRHTAAAEASLRNRSASDPSSRDVAAGR